MKYKIIFTLLLTLIIAVGIKGIDIAGYFFSDNSLEETVISRDSVKSSAVYIASPDEISFNPMEIIETGDDPDNYIEPQYPSITSGKHVCAAILEALSSYSRQTQYASAVNYGIYSSLKYSRNDYFYLDKYEYFNPDGELRYLDCIITPTDYRIVYINFYSDKEYDLNADDISKGLKKFQENSGDFYLDADLSDNKYAKIIESLFFSGETVESLPNAYKEAFEFFDSVSGYGNIRNPVEYFWFRSFVINTVPFFDKSFYDPDVYEEYDFDQDMYATPAYGTGYIIEIIDCLSATQDESEFTDTFTTNAEYVAYNGRIYQTFKLDGIYYYTDTVIVIYNIEEEIIEGFYAPPD